jgi:recombination protein RecT
MSTSQLKSVVAPDAAKADAARAVNPAVTALTSAMAGIASVLPKHITADRMSKIALGCLRTNRKLYDAAKRNPSSFVNAIMSASRLGLEPGIDAHLIPYENRKANTVEIQMIPDWRGLLALARRSGMVTSISIQLVHQHDEFELELGLAEKLVHKPLIHGDRGPVILGYAVARFSDGSHHVEWMSTSSINAIRDASQNYRTAVKYNRNDNPWQQHWDEMARKTIARRISKYLPRSIEIINAETLIDAADQGKAAAFDGAFVVIDGDSDLVETQDTTQAAAIGGAQATGAPEVTFAALSAQIESSADADALDLSASLISGIADAKEKATLTALAEEKRKALNF